MEDRDREEGCSGINVGVPLERRLPATLRMLPANGCQGNSVISEENATIQINLVLSVK
jgi:hypothetical protein